MNIVLFQEITTDEALKQLEAEGKKYAGLYVDMDNAKERKYVKESAASIGDLLKKLDRARIDKAKSYKASIESEAKDIRERLEAANLPFSKLIDEHKEKRAKILAEEKEKAEVEELLLQIEYDHDQAIMLDKIRTIEAAEREQEWLDNEKRIADEAAETARLKAEEAAQAAIDLAEQSRKDAIAREEQSTRDAEESARQAIAAEERAKAQALQAEVDAKAAAAQAIIRAEEQAKAAVKAEQNRIAEVARVEAEEQARRDRNTQHKGEINRKAASDLMGFAGLTDIQAKKAVIAIAKGQISNVSIKY